MGIWSKKSIEDLKSCHEEKNSQLTRTLTTFDLILIGIGCVIGAGIFSITGIAAAENAGPAIVISFILASVGCAFAGLCYSELAAMIPISGSAYTYAYVSMGELVAWLIGWSLILEYAIGASTVAISWSAYAISFLQDFGIILPAEIAASPWQHNPITNTANHTGLFNLPAVLIIVVISLILIRGIRHSASINAVIVLIKVSVVLVFIGIGIFYINPENYVPFIPENTGTFGSFGWSGILRASGVIFFAYIGFDAISTTALETKDPNKSLPRGILGSLTICTILFIAFSFVLTGLANYKDLDVAAPVAVAIANTPFPWLQQIIKLGILAGLTSVMLVLLLGQSRIFFVMACDGMLPKVFSRLHPSFHTPWICNLILMIAVAVIAAFTPLSIVGHMTSIGTLMAFTLVCMGVMILRYRHPEYPRPFKVPLFPFVPIMGILTCTGMMAFLGLSNWIRLISWLLVGLCIYFGYSRHQTKHFN